MHCILVPLRTLPLLMFLKILIERPYTSVKYRLVPALKRFFIYANNDNLNQKSNRVPMFANVGGAFRGSFKTLVKVSERSLGFETKILPQYSLEIVVFIF